jgi:hypothetical protein
MVAAGGADGPPRNTRRDTDCLLPEGLKMILADGLQQNSRITAAPRDSTTLLTQDQRIAHETSGNNHLRQQYLADDLLLHRVALAELPLLHGLVPKLHHKDSKEGHR